MAPQLKFQWPQRRGPSDPWFRIGNIDVSTTAIVVALGVLSFFIYAVDKAFLFHLAYSPPDIARGQLWRLITWPMVNQPDIFTAFTLFILWIFGHDLEAQFGRIRFTKYLAMVVIIPAIITMGAYYVLGGDNGSNQLSIAIIAVQGIRLLELGVFVAYVAERPGARFFFGIPAWVLVAVFIGLDVLRYLGNRLWLALVFELLVAGMALVLLRSFGFGAGVQWVPKVGLPAFIVGEGVPRNRPSSGGSSRPSRASGAKPSRRAGKSSTKTSGLTSDSSGGVVTGPWEGSSSAPASEREVDAILDKIAANGMESLTSDERRALEEASRRRRDGRT